MSFQRTILVPVTPELAAREPYHTVPFTVPPGTRSLEVSYEVGGKASAADPPGSGNVVDIGLLDPRAAGFPARDGFRGWSGSARSSFQLSESGATPGYLPGPLPAGEWNIVLGLYRIMPGAHTVTVTVRGSEEDLAPAATPAAPATRAAGSPHAGWFRGDLHAHTHHSDARGSLDDLLEMARRRGLDYLAVTDHNTVSHHAPLLAADTGGLTVIPGQELTTYRGHTNMLGLPGWVDFRFTDDDRLRLALADARERGALRVINHPKPTGCDWEYGEWEDFDLFEVWNGPWPTRNWVSVRRWHDRLAA
ncbi:MAG TPA: CehA/McbA family metallohydrolase, partial [Deinococcales bacterium]|nr:CehA/McbA family metallohydrolase [Deinococcales bacterium]